MALPICGWFDFASVRQVARQDNAGANVSVGLLNPAFQGIIQGNSAIQLAFASA